MQRTLTSEQLADLADWVASVWDQANRLHAAGRYREACNAMEDIISVVEPYEDALLRMSAHIHAGNIRPIHLH